MDATTGYVSREFVFLLIKGDCPVSVSLAFVCIFEIYDNGHVCCCPALHGVTTLERLKNLVYCHCVPEINREPEKVIQ